MVFLLNNKSVRKSRANLFLSVLLVSLSFNIAHILYAPPIINHFGVQVYSVGDLTFLLIAPLLWFYTSELTGRKIQWSWSRALHFLPFFVVMVITLFFRSVDSASFIAFIDKHHRLFMILFWIGVTIQFSCYQYFVHQRWRIYRRLVEEEVSNTEGVNISWVRFFMAVFVMINLFFLVILFSVIHFETNFWLYKTTALILSLSIFALGYRGMLQKEIFQNQLPEYERKKKISSLTDPGKRPDRMMIDRLTAYMEENKPYLDPELTLTGLAKKIEISRSQLSQLINMGVGHNFYDFVNKYRVEEVKRLMVDPKIQNFSLLGIAMEAGFKSKSTFNLIFKRFTGLTPSEYRKNLLS